MVYEKVMPASRLPEMGRGAACRAFDLAQSLNVIHRHYRRIHGQDHCVFDEDRLMAHILDCVGTLRRMQALFDPYNTDNQELQTAREETFQKALYLMLHHSTETGGGAINSLCESFPGFGDTSASSQSNNKRSWQPTHWSVIAMDKERPHQHQSNSTVPSKSIIQSDSVDNSPVKSEHDTHYVRTVQLFVAHDEKSLSLSQFGVNPTLPNQLYIPHWQEQHTPADLLCMQAQSNLDVIKHLDFVIPGIFSQGCSLELAARYSTSRTLVEFLLQQQPRGESKTTFKGELHRYPGYPLTLLLKRAAEENSQMQRQIQSQREVQGLRGAGEGVDNDDDDSRRLFDDLFDLFINANHTPEVVGDALHCLLSSSCTSLGEVKKLELCKKMIALQPQAIHVKCGGVRDCFPLQTYIEGLAHTPSSAAAAVCTSACVLKEKEDDKNDDDLNTRKALFNYLLTIHPDAVKAMDAEGLVPVFRAVGGFPTPPDIVKTLVTKYPEGLRLRDRDGLLPAHVASVQGTKAHLEILLQAYPASVAERTEPRAGLGGGDENVLQYACRSQNDPYHLSSYFRQKLQQQYTAQNHSKQISSLSSSSSSSTTLSLPPPENGDVLAITSGRARQTFRSIDIDKVLTLLSFLKNKTVLHGVHCWRQELLHARDSNGWMLLHHLACYCTSIEVFQTVFEADPDCFHEVAIKVIETETGELMFLDPTDEADVVHMQSDDTGWDFSFCPYLRTSLHMFLAMNKLNDPLDPIAHTFRYLISISDSRILSARDSYGHTPYDFLAHDWSTSRILLAHVPTPGLPTTEFGETVTDTIATLVVNDNQHALSNVDPLGSKVYFQRIILNACPTVNIDAYHQLNYEARRGGIYLGYIIPIAALRKEEKKHFLWRQLRLVESSLLKSIIMFL